MAEGQAFAVAGEVLSNTQGLTVADVASCAAKGIIKDVQEGEFTEDAVVWLRQEC